MANKSFGVNDLSVSGNVAGFGLTSMTAKSATGTEVDFTGIPSWVKRITVMFDGVSNDGTTSILVQIGDSGGIATMDYKSSSGTGGTTSTSIEGFVMRQVVEGDTGNGMMTIALLGSNVWVSSHNLHRTNTNVSVFGAGSKTLSGTLTQLRITTVSGTDEFDDGTINVMYE